MSAIVIDGKALSLKVHQRLKQDVETFVAKGNDAPHLAVVLVGQDPASQVYVRSKTNKAKKAGMQVSDVCLEDDIDDSKLQSTLNELSKDPALDGILLQLPLPGDLDEFRALLSIDPAKDVDGLHPYSQGLLVRGADGFKPCTPFGCMLLIEEACKLLGRDTDLSGLNAVVVGRSVLVGKPMASLLLEANCTVTVAHSRTQDLTKICAAADILVAAVGRPEMITGDYVKSGAIVIDVGINRTASGSLVGDCEYSSCQSVASAITPVPGGVGPMTIAVLLQNTFYSASQRKSRVI